jgi:glucose uptake protein
MRGLHSSLTRVLDFVYTSGGARDVHAKRSRSVDQVSGNDGIEFLGGFMYVPTAFGIALIMMVTSTICWGSWANTFKLTRNYRFELFYWDYALGIVLISLILAFTIGSTPAGPTSFLNNIHTADSSNLVSALIGGFIFNIANLLLVAGIELAGLAVAFPLSIGIALVVGVVLSYCLQPKGNPGLLALGVGLAVVAVVMIGKAYGQLPGGERSTSRKSIVVCVVSGLLMGTFAPFVTRALTHGAALTPYSISVFFTLGALLCCFVVNVYFMRRPLTGTPVDFSGYFSAPIPYHLLGLIGGIIWGLGGVFNFVAASLTGVAISYAIGQAAPMVAALWGVFVWKEFAGASSKAKLYLVGMFVSYVLALIVISYAYQRA